MKKIITLILIFPIALFSQERLEGHIYEGNSTNEKRPLAGANVYWLGTSVGDVTSMSGRFSIPYSTDYTSLVVSYIGFKTDTLTIQNSKSIEHWLQPTNTLDEIRLEQRKKTTSLSYLKSLNVITMSSDELLKSACCNLCESFETNPSIDVNFADALTGTKQIKMLGLTSPYILTAIESVPSIRGASQAFGLSFIPGTWVESIQITKGAGSVMNGFESFTGQINAKLQKPVKDHEFFLNAYGAGNGRFEINTHLNKKLSDRWFTGLYVHGNSRNHEFDKNGDSFLDMPLAKQFNVMNRWQFTDLEKGIVLFLDARFLNDEKQMGQTHFNSKNDKFTRNAWGSEIDTKRFDGSMKFSFQNQNLKHQTIDVQTTFSNHDQEAYYGLNVYSINHKSLYSRAIYGSIITNTKHTFKTGLNYTYDSYKEVVGNYENSRNYRRSEKSIGAFFEYNFDDLEDVNITAGVRIDHHNILNTFITPRLHVRVIPWENSSLKFSLGRGKRSANIFAENQNIFATNRSLMLHDSGGKIYGLDPEIAWNYGGSLLQGFNLFGRKGDIAIDFYRTNFENQIVVDWENPTEVHFYNLDGTSYSNSFQTEINFEPFDSFNIRLAYKNYDVKTQYTSGKLNKPLTPKNRFFTNASYESSKKENGSQWKYDFTYNWLGKQRFASTASNPLEYQLDAYSPTIGTINAQITKVFSNKFELYLGGENITNIKQENPILGAENPFGEYFDTTFVYGPIFGSTYYAGLRYKLN